MCCTVGELGSDCMIAGSSKDSTRGSSSCNVTGQVEGGGGRGREGINSKRQPSSLNMWKHSDGG